ncbi:PadR family transcriptional regulator [bacterium]|nr:PadR family transcriptional regulator [bacterium]MBU1638622.1 PadR family transcriptional regulator [bacterium]MBU1919696.1 PadR family transcriptional regulator [bacterium]
MDELRSELKRGTIEMILLILLNSKEMYGYQLVSELEKRGGALFQVKEGTLYPVLYRLEDKGFIESYRDIPERGVPRKYYKLTKSGIGYLQELLSEWRSFVNVIESFTEPKER